MELQAFVTNLGKYNEGILVGEWVTFPIDEEEKNKLMKKIGCSYIDENGIKQNQQYEEYFITDYENSDVLNLGEYVSIDRLNEYAEKIDEYDENFLKAVDEFADLKSVLDDDKDDLEYYNYYSDIKDDYDLGYYYVEEAGIFDTKYLGNLVNYIDYESLGRDIRFESNGLMTSTGWIERC